MTESKHFQEMLLERLIEREWVDRTVDDPDELEYRDDRTQHFLKQISERENRWLRVIVNTAVAPPRLITAFFDRRLRNRL